MFQGVSPISETLDLSVGNTWSKNLVFKNNGTTSATFAASLSGPDATKFKVSINRCATTSTAKGKTCQVTIESARGLSKKLDPYAITFDSVNINLTVTDSTAPPVSNEPAAPVSLFNFTPETIPLVEFAPGELNKSITLTIKNNGEQTEQPVVTIDSAGSLNLTYLINRCTTSVAATKTCSVQLRVNNPPDSNIQSKLVKIFVGNVEKDSILISAAQSNLCVPNSKKTCSVQNAQTANQLCSSDGKSYGQCIPESCLNGFSLNNNQCLSNTGPETYTAIYSEYNPLIPQNQQSCDGTVVSNRTISSCTRDSDNASVATSFCSDSQSQKTTTSPAGNRSFSISNGSELRYCPLGSSVQTFISRICDPGFFNNGSACAVQICAPSSTAACSENNGSGLKTCNAQGSAYNSCEISSCNEGYFFHVETGVCMQNTGNGIFLNNAGGTHILAEAVTYANGTQPAIDKSGPFDQNEMTNFQYALNGSVSYTVNSSQGVRAVDLINGSCEMILDMYSNYFNGEQDYYENIQYATGYLDRKEGVNIGQNFTFDIPQLQNGMTFSIVGLKSGQQGPPECIDLGSFYKTDFPAINFVSIPTPTYSYSFGTNPLIISINPDLGLDSLQKISIEVTDQYDMPLSFGNYYYPSSLSLYQGTYTTEVSVGDVYSDITVKVKTVVYTTSGRSVEHIQYVTYSMSNDF